MSSGKPLIVEIVAYAPTAYYHCTHCEVAWRSMGVSNNFHDEQVNSSLPPDIAQDYQKVSDWVHEIFRVHCDRVVVKVIDAASIEGFYKSLKYRLHSYPMVIVEGKHKFGNDSLQEASAEIARELGEPLTSPNRA